MHSFGDIESLRHVASRINQWSEYHGLETKPTITFNGTVKLHGSNGGVRVHNGRVIPQSRSQELTVGKTDNAGFALFCSSRVDEFKRIANQIAPSSNDVTIFGEWCGTGIMKGCGIHKLPKMFIIFDIRCHADGIDNPFHFEMGNRVVDDVEWFNNQNIYFISQFPTFRVDIDFENPSAAAELITEMTLSVEESCPVSNSPLFYAFNHGENIGIGEGIVWVSEGHHERLVFKSKGLKHKKAGTAPRVELAPEVVEGIRALVDAVLPEWRLQQGLDFMASEGKELLPQNTGIYLAWVSKDVIKEESDRIAANGFEWKDIQKAVQSSARRFYLEQAAVL